MHYNWKSVDHVGVWLTDVSLRWRHPRGAWRNTLPSRGIISSVHGRGCTVWRRNSCRFPVVPSWGTTTIPQHGLNNIASALGESIDIRRWAATTALHLATATTLSSISATAIAPMSCVAHVECQSFRPLMMWWRVSWVAPCTATVWAF
jgi:hypothetical protein